jgi:hypothetical protein
VQTKRRGVRGHALAVATRVFVSGFDGLREADDDRLRRVEFVGEAFETHQRSDTGAQFGRIDRLGQEVVRAGVNASEPVGAAIEAREQHHGDEPGGRIFLQPATQLDAVQRRHVDVGEHEIGRLAADQRHGDFAVRCRKDLVAVGPQRFRQRFEQRRHVVGDDDLACGALAVLIRWHSAAGIISC